MHELLMMVSGWWMNHAQDSLLRYLTHSAVTLAMVGAVAWLGDRMLRRVGPQAQHRMWVAALLISVALPLLPAGWLARLGPADTSVGLGTSTVTYNMVAAARERWTISPLLCAMLAAAYLLTLLFYMVRLLWRGRRTRAMARRATMLRILERCGAAVRGGDAGGALLFRDAGTGGAGPAAGAAAGAGGFLDNEECRGDPDSE
jgi:flagellar biogenesis protein FliO